MKKDFRLYQKLGLLTVSVSVMSLLSGCDLMNVENPFPEQHAKQEVTGDRHAPVLNPPPSPQEFRQAAAPAPQAAVPSAPTPYDSYDASGNMVAPLSPAQAPAPAAAQESQQGGFFDRLFGSSGSASQENAPHKPIPGNPNSPQAVTAISPFAAPVQQTPPALASQPSEVAPVVPPMPEASEQENTPSAEDDAEAQQEENVPAPVAAPPPPPPPVIVVDGPIGTAPKADNADQPSFFVRSKSWVNRQLGIESDKTAGDAAPSAVVIDKNAPMPSLSSVPPTPPELQSTKDATPLNKETLQNDHDMAQEQKANVDSEPSQQSMTPVGPVTETPPAQPPQAVPTPPPAVQPEAAAPKIAEEKPAAADIKPSTPPAESSDEPVMLGHLSAPPPAVLNAKPDVQPETVAAPASSTPSKPVAAPVTPVTSSDTIVPSAPSPDAAQQ